MVTNAPPSGNQANRHTLTGVMKHVLDNFLKKTDDMLPAKVISYNAATNTAQVQPLIMVVTTDDQLIERAQYAAIPVYQASAGGFILRFPVSPGDFGWIKANDRDISLFRQTNSMSAPNTQRKHSFKDAIFFPQCAFDLVTINSEDANNMVLQNYAGTVRIALWGDQVKITAPNVIFDTPTTTFTGIIDVQNVNSETNPCTINGNISTNADVIAGTGSTNISLLNHHHTGVTTGGGNTGGPVG